MIVRSKPTVYNNDKRIFIDEFTTEKNTKEKYPLGSFSVEFIISTTTKKIVLFTTESNSPNTFFFKTTTKNKNKLIRLSNSPKTGNTSNFCFYENTLFLQNKNNFYNIYHSVNFINNIRWVIFNKISKNFIESTTTKASVWPEREIQDMFNVKIKNLKDSRRLLLDYKIKKGALINEKVANINNITPKFNLYADIFY